MLKSLRAESRLVLHESILGEERQSILLANKLDVGRQRQAVIYHASEQEEDKHSRRKDFVDVEKRNTSKTLFVG